MYSTEQVFRILNKECVTCGKKVNTNRNIYCSVACHVKTGDKNPSYKGGKTTHPLYGIYHSMFQRCYVINHSQFPDYGGRGIYVCDRWRQSFWHFVEDMGERPLGYSIDRIDNDGPYSSDNCQWADDYQQRRNQRRYIAIHKTD